MRRWSLLSFPVIATLLTAVVLQAQAPMDALKTCKNEVGARYLNIPMAYINVDRGSNAANGNYLVNWNTMPPNGRSSAGFCVIDRSWNVLRFETTSGPGPGGGGGGGGVSGDDAMRACKSEAANRLPSVPSVYITVTLGQRAPDGGYRVNWRAQPPMGMRRSGYCDVDRNARVRNFQYDNSSGGGGSVDRQPPGQVQYSGWVRNRNSTKCLSVANRSTALAANIEQQGCGGSAHLQWEFVVVGRGVYAIRNVNSGYVLDVAGLSRDNGANVQQYSWTGADNQRWRLNNAAGGTQIINVNSGKCLDVAYQGKGNGNNIIQWDCHGSASQRWDVGVR